MMTSAIWNVYVLQLVYLAGCIFWNVAGVILQSKGMQPLGPTASWAAAGLMVVPGLLAWWGLKSKSWHYMLASALMGLGGLAAIVPALTSDDPSLWPSPFWRWAGIVLNLFGLVLAIVGIYLTMKAMRGSPKGKENITNN
ncbi:MAG: hypothetical protein JNJ77_03610 [Planctomycetia bacterium]|nr:hypothetical protein [Planctomycetia bacterium]